jgi:hypothetical protein
MQTDEIEVVVGKAWAAAEAAAASINAALRVDVDRFQAMAQHYKKAVALQQQETAIYAAANNAIVKALREDLAHYKETAKCYKEKCDTQEKEMVRYRERTIQ